MTGSVVAVLLAAAASYWAGRFRPGQRLDRWAASKVGGPHGAGWWAAQVVMAVEIGWLVAAHPRRTAARIREDREFKRAPAPQFDSQWAVKRGTTAAPADEEPAP